MTASAATRPRTFGLTVPSDWDRIDLDPDRRAVDVARLIRRRGPHGDELAQLRRDLRVALLGQAAQAAEGGGTQLYLSFLPAGGATVPCSLVASVTVPLPGVAADLTTAADLLSDRPWTTSCSRVDLPAGPAVRRTWRRPASSTATGHDAGTADSVDPGGFGLELQVPVPEGEGGFVVLAFAGPLLPLEPALIQLFDAVCRSLRWVW